jgi:hypothetical protein
MSYPYDRPATEPGGMECCECGVIFVGSEAHDQCAVCANNGWRPIDTAPKDGTNILLHNGTLAGVGCCELPYDHWMGTWVHHPTHWQPLPKPPVTP